MLARSRFHCLVVTIAIGNVRENRRRARKGTALGQCWSFPRRSCRDWIDESRTGDSRPAQEFGDVQASKLNPAGAREVEYAGGRGDCCRTSTPAECTAPPGIPERERCHSRRARSDFHRQGTGPGRARPQRIRWSRSSAASVCGTRSTSQPAGGGGTRPLHPARPSRRACWAQRVE